ncbi:MAG: hypothetical protein QW610_03005 [Pyrobaculum sp.]
MFSKIKLGLEEWKKIEDELQRISLGEPLELVINLTLVAIDSGGHIEEEHHHVHNHDFEYNEFTRDVVKMIDEISRRYKVEIHQHLHSNHGSVMFTIRDNPKNLLKTLKDILEYIKLDCEKCTLHTLDGEFHIGDDLAGLYFGDLYKLTIILPGEDGRRLKVHEVHF